MGHRLVRIEITLMSRAFSALLEEGGYKKGRKKGEHHAHLL